MEDNTFSVVQLRIVTACANQCQRENTAPQAVAWLIGAYDYVLRRMLQEPVAEAPIQLSDVVAIGQLVEPYHVGGVYPDKVAGLSELLDTQHQLRPLIFFQRFVLLSPLRTNNYHAGWLMWNWLNGTLTDPRPTPGGTPT